MSVYLQKWISRADLRANSDALFVFGDNEERWGLGGQAKECRGEPNAVGVATLFAPGHFWRDDIDANRRQCAVIDHDFAPIFAAAKVGHLIVFPVDGIGTGLADLERRSPATFAHLQRRVAELKSINGGPHGSR
jgi:hypothetical protein